VQQVAVNAIQPFALTAVEAAQLLGAIREQWLQGIAESRGAGAREASEDGPFGAEDAKSRGLVDAVGYLDEARDDAKKLSGGRSFDLRFGVAAHAAEHPDFAVVSAAEVLRGQGVEVDHAERFAPWFVMLPHLHDTDGFFAAVLEKAA